MKYPVIISNRNFLLFLFTAILTACGGDNRESNSGSDMNNKPSGQNNSDGNQNSGDGQNAGENNPQIFPFEAKGGSYGSLFNAWKFPYLLFQDDVNNLVADGITYTLIRSANGDWDIKMDGRHTVLNTRYDDFLQGRWNYSTQNSIAGIYETYDTDNDITRLTYFDNGRIYRQQFDGNDLLTEQWYLDNGSEIRIAYDAWDLDSELTITNQNGNSALIYYNCASAATLILTMTIQQLNIDCRSNKQEYN